MANLIFTEKPRPIKTLAKKHEFLNLNKIIAMNKKRIIRDKCLVSTSSDNMHHV